MTSHIADQLWDAQFLRRAINAAEVALWSWNVETDLFSMDRHAFAIWGIADNSMVTFEDLSAKIHPSDRNRVRAAFAATRAHVGAYEIDFRILVGDVVRWVSARGQGSDIGKVDDTVMGIFLDVTARKQAEEGNELLAGEMSHRVKNLLAIANSLTLITSRTTTTTVDMARELTQRLTALGRAHDLVRPLPGHEGKAALLGDLFTILLAPYDDNGAFEGRIRVAVPRVSVGETTATTLALIVHELATNSLKYGSLSGGSGTLDVSGVNGEKDLIVLWIERGGPTVKPPTNPEGFGNTMVKRAIQGQLGGSIEYDWSAEGVAVRLVLDKSHLSL
ncbi:sensor histidine kinase [Rhizobium sp. TRM95796]|uniref:sensor histidine kinase n=1 Tax=Rhizobium sp. TRM95796 TaxID=2979862 RepID=UPI0021E9A20F|nr:HWE histidine kinase domain-containing protein [Rhizobium sp. TRM95796]MCV3768746.1 histidine kinase [Rhizobium sp. TRM95796]